MATPTPPAFLKPSDANASSKPSGSSAGTPASIPEKPHKGTPRWVLPVVLVVVLLAGVASCFLFLRHRAETHPAQDASGGTAASKNQLSKAVAPVATVDLPLDPFVVNLADAGGHSYARIGLTLQLDAPAGASGKDDKEGAATAADSPKDMVRDTIITVLNQEQSTDLLAQGGKEHLKQAIRTAIAARDPHLKIADIYFTEFLVQQ